MKYKENQNKTLQLQPGAHFGHHGNYTPVFLTP